MKILEKITFRGMEFPYPVERDNFIRYALQAEQDLLAGNKLNMILPVYNLLFGGLPKNHLTGLLRVITKIPLKRFNETLAAMPCIAREIGRS